MKKIKKVLLICICLMLLLASCGNENTKTADKEVVLNIAYQYGIAYAPVLIAMEQKTIEEAYQEMTGKNVKIVWSQMSSGPDINTGISSGNIDVGFMGVAPAITGETKGAGYKIFSNLSGQEHSIMTNDSSIHDLGDIIGSSKQIALVNIGSIQHIILAKALDEAGYDMHALDSNIVAMKHPDGMAALMSGNVACHLTTNPYLYNEREQDGLVEIKGITEAWDKDKSFIVGVASEDLYNNDPELYKALCKGIEDAINFINNNTEDAASITSKYNGNNLEDEKYFLQEGNYSIETHGVLELAQFMQKAGFIEDAPEEISNLVFDNVSGD